MARSLIVLSHAKQVHSEVGHTIILGEMGMVEGDVLSPFASGASNEKILPDVTVDRYVYWYGRLQ